MAQLENMRLPAVAREALVDDPNFLRELVEAALNRFLDAEISEHLQAGPYERSEVRAGYRNGYRSRQLKTRVGTLTLNVPMDRDGTFKSELFERPLTACFVAPAQCRDTSHRAARPLHVAWLRKEQHNLGYAALLSYTASDRHSAHLG